MCTRRVLRKFTRVYWHELDGTYDARSAFLDTKGTSMLQLLRNLWSLCEVRLQSDFSACGQILMAWISPSVSSKALTQVKDFKVCLSTVQVNASYSKPTESMAKSGERDATRAQHGLLGAVFESALCLVGNVSGNFVNRYTISSSKSSAPILTFIFSVNMHVVDIEKNQRGAWLEVCI